MKTNTTSLPTTVLTKDFAPMTAMRKTSLVAGIFYLLTFVSIPTLALYGPIHLPGFMTGSDPDGPVVIGGILEIIVALSGIATAVVLYPVLKKQNEGAALGLVTSRIVEAGTMFAGVAFLLAVVILRREGAGADASVAAHTLVTLYDRIFLLGQSTMPAFNDILLGLLLYHSRLVPRSLAWIGIIGAPVLITGDLLVLFDVIGQRAPLTGLFAVPVAVFELALGIWLVVKGFKPSAITGEPSK